MARAAESPFAGAVSADYFSLYAVVSGPGCEPMALHRAAGAHGLGSGGAGKDANFLFDRCLHLRAAGFSLYRIHLLGISRKGVRRGGVSLNKRATHFSMPRVRRLLWFGGLWFASL